MSTVDAIALVAALGWRVVRVPDLGKPAVLLPRHRLALLDTALSDDQADLVLDHALANAHALEAAG